MVSDSKPDKVYEVVVTTPVYGGETLGRMPDGRAVFVPFTLPGEKVRIRLIQEKRGFARAKLLEVLEPSPNRIPPRCKHFGVCGGCHYQHIPYPLQLEIKSEIVADQLKRIGGIENPPVEPTVPSGKEWFYRNHVQFHLDPEGNVGFLEAQSDRVVAIEENFLMDEVLSDIWPALQFEPRTELERVNLRSGSDGEAMLVLESETLETPELTVEELPISVVHLSPAGALVLAGSETLTMEVLGRAFSVSAGSFFQVNTSVAEAIINHLLHHLSLTPETTVLELYSGAGLFSAFIAPKVQRLVAVESAPSSTADFEVNLDEFDNVELYEAPVEDTLPSLNFQPDVLLADPPRAGLGRKVVEEILRLQPEFIAYVSCDPSTLARDLKGLVEGGYQVKRVTPFDMFPQTYHVESVTFLTR